MNCSDCLPNVRVALYHVGPTGFCKLHYGNAVTLRKSVSRRQEERRHPVFDTIIDEVERNKRAVRRMRNACPKRRR